jgi:hypothetical protein
MVSKDWETRDFTEKIQLNILKITNFLNNFGKLFNCTNNLCNVLIFVFSIRTDASMRYYLARLDEKLTILERNVEVVQKALSSNGGDAQ